MNPHEPALLRARNGHAVPLVEVTGTARAEGLLLQTTFRQRYANRSADNIEAVYTFPLPHGAVLLGLAFTLGERRLKGVVAERRQAEERYEEALDEGHSAVLLERTAEGLFTVSIGNLLAGEEATVEVHYAQLLSFVQGQLRIAIPTVIAPRFGDPGTTGLPPHATPETDLGANYRARFTVELDGETARGVVACPSHDAEPRRVGERVSVEIEGQLDRDFIVTVDGLAGRPLVAMARDADGWVALASFVPAVRARASDAPLCLKVLVDCSGSMNGDSIGQARNAVSRLLHRLTAPDRVSVSAFGSSVAHHRSGLRTLDEAHRADCLQWANALQAKLGGTEMHGALASLFELGGERGRDADVFLLTDGEVWNTEEIIALARARDQRVFVVAVGSSPAESLLARLAQETGGAAEFVTPNESIEDALMRLLARLRQPRARDVRVRWPLAPEWTAPVPRALFGGETLHALARFGVRPRGEVALEWRDEAAQAQGLALPSEDPATTSHDDALPRVAAGLAVTALPEQRQGAFAERYRLVTSQTSMVLVLERDEDERSQALPRSVKVPQMLAAGWGGVGSVAASSLVFESHRDLRTSDDQLMTRNEWTLSSEPSPRFSRRSTPLVDPADPLAGLAWLVNDLWDRAGALPADIDAIERTLPEPWCAALREQASQAGCGEAALVAWLIVELLGSATHPPRVHRQALRAARRLARGTPDAVGRILRARIGSLSAPGEETAAIVG